MSSEILPLRRDSKSTLQVFEALRCFVLTFHANATGRDMSRAFCALFEGRPELTGYDLIENLTEFGGEVSQADVQAIAECYAQRNDDNDDVRHSFIVTGDVNYRLWAPAMDHFFPGRRHHVAATLEEAWAELNRLRER